MVEDKLYCVGQKAFIDKDGEVLVLTVPEFGLDFPGGKIQAHETDFAEALKREVREETSLEIEVGDPFVTWERKARSQTNLGKLIFLVGHKCKYLSGEIKLSDEHEDFEWVNKENYKKLDDGSAYFKALEKYFSRALSSVG